AKVGYTAPSIDGQARVIAMAQEVAGVAPETVSYVEAHGTGTPLGDPIEVAALRKVFHGVTEEGVCALGSVKSNFGHLDIAAGIAGLIKTVLALEHRQIPPSLHGEPPNPALELEGSPFTINTRLREWPAGSTPRAGVAPPPAARALGGRGPAQGSGTSLGDGGGDRLAVLRRRGEAPAGR
ncbi:MAG: polyketide synthase, partial [bacterium]|nr:polyketide synthase [bacterium]